MFSRHPDLFWVVPGHLAGGRWPDEEARQALHSLGFRVVINLTPLPYADECFVVHTIPIMDGHPPTLAQIDQFLRVVQECSTARHMVYVHCIAGLGRTGTLLACFLVAQESCTATEAIARIRMLRPGALETLHQEQIVETFAQSVSA